jgi:hypothetical protein
MGHWSPSTSGTASRRSNLYQMLNNRHSVILKNVGINLFCSGTWNMFRGELGFEFSALCGLAATAGPLAEREGRFGNRRIGKLACQRVWVRSASPGTRAHPCVSAPIGVNQCNRWLKSKLVRLRVSSTLDTRLSTPLLLS